MTGLDLAEWEMFEALHGPILLHERIDVAAALIQAAVYRAGGAKLNRDDLVRLMPSWDGQHELDEDQLIANVRSLMKPKEEPSP